MASQKFFENLLQYTRWANDRVFTALDQCGSQLPATSLRYISHIANAQSVWLNRIHGQPLIVSGWDEHDLERCKQLNAQVLDGFQVLLEQPIDLDKKVAYKNFSGIACEDGISDMLLQVFNHGTYHRAQIALDLRVHGFEAVNTDYINFARAR